MTAPIAHHDSTIEGQESRTEGYLPARSGTLDRMVAAIALLGAAYLLCHLIAFEYGRDQGIYAVVADGVLRGEAPYRDVWDFKPPGIFFVFALAEALFGPSMHAIRVLEALGFLSLVWAFAIYSRRHLGNALPGIVGGAFAVLAHVQLEYWNTAQPSSFGAIVLAWALVCATYEPSGGIRRRGAVSAAWLAAGALYAVGALLKPPLGGGIVVSWGFIAWRRCRLAPAGDRVTAVVTPLVFLVAGALIPLALVVGYFTTLGAIGDMYDALFVFAPGYTALGLRDASLAGLMVRAVNEWITDFSVVNTIGLVLLLGLPAVGERGREGALHVFAIVVLVLFGVALQAKFFPYHYDAAIALTGLLAGWGFWKLWVLAERPLGTVAVGTLAAVSIVLALQQATRAADRESLWARCDLRLTALLNPRARDVISEQLYPMADVHEATNRRVAAWLRTQTPPDASIYVWGFEPIIYDLAGRRPASRYVYNVPQRTEWAGERSRALLIEELDRSRPAALVVEHGDRIPWVTGNMRDSAEALHDFPGLQALLETRYEHVGSIGQFDLYLLSASAERRSADT